MSSYDFYRTTALSGDGVIATLDPMGEVVYLETEVDDPFGKIVALEEYEARGLGEALVAMADGLAALAEGANPWTL